MLLDITVQKIDIAVCETTSALFFSLSLSVTENSLSIYDGKAVIDSGNSCFCWHISLQMCYEMSFVHWGYRETFVFFIG